MIRFERRKGREKDESALSTGIIFENPFYLFAWNTGAMVATHMVNTQQLWFVSQLVGDGATKFLCKFRLF
jgi:hypothetical protein